MSAVSADPLGEPAAATRWLGVGSSGAADSRRAGAEAAAEALLGRDAQLLVVFCSESYDLQGLLEAIDDRSQGSPLIGCSTAGEIATGGPADASVVVVALGGEGFSVETAVAENASGRLR